MTKSFQKNRVYPEIELNLIFIHGVWSNGNVFDELAERFSRDDRLKGIKMKVSVIKYGRLLLSVGRIPFVRTLVSNYIASRLATCTYKYPNAKTVIFAHSFGTWATAQAVRDLFREFRLHMAILVGSVVPRKFDWSCYELGVHNFVGKRDIVVLSSALWGTGWSGRFGFKPSDGTQMPGNVTQHYMCWDHNDYPNGYDDYVKIIQEFVAKDQSLNAENKYSSYHLSMQGDRN